MWRETRLSGSNEIIIECQGLRSLKIIGFNFWLNLKIKGRYVMHVPYDA